MIPAMMTGTTSSRDTICYHSVHFVGAASSNEGRRWEGERAERERERILLTIRSGRSTPMAEMPTPDLAVPYAAPKQVKTMAEVQPIAPKKG